MKNIIIYLLLLLIVSSCVQTPADFSQTGNESAVSGDILVLCEGLMGYDNSQLTLVKTTTGKVIKDYFNASNIGMRLGDTANDIFTKGDTAYVASTMGGFIEIIRISSGRSLGRILLPAGSMPRKLFILNDTLGFASNLLKNNIMFFNPREKEFVTSVECGPQPEGIALNDNLIFTANSAYGDFNWKHPDAETISVIDINKKIEIGKIKAGTNVCELIISTKRNKLYAAYYNLPSKKDSAGGIIEYELSNLSETRRWITNPRNIQLSTDQNQIFFINQHQSGRSDKWSGVSQLNLISGEIENIITKMNDDIWYGLSVNPDDNSIWICNSKNHNIDGEIIVYSGEDFTKPKYRFDCGMNPNKIIFY